MLTTQYGVFMKIAFLGLALSAFTIPAFAESTTSLDFLVGLAKQSSEYEGTEFSSGDDISLGLRLAIGINKNVAAEISYQGFGETNDTYIDQWGDTINDKVSSNAATLGLKGIIPINNQASLNARLGIARWDLDVKTTDTAFPGIIFKYDDSGTDLYYGVGGQFKITPQFSIGVEYTIVPMDVNIDGDKIDHQVENLTGSLSYSF
jgi:opacity protein-like surface antigen